MILKQYSNIPERIKIFRWRFFDVIQIIRFPIKGEILSFLLFCEDASARMLSSRNGIIIRESGAIRAARIFSETRRSKRVARLRTIHPDGAHATPVAKGAQELLFSCVDWLVVPG